MSGGASSPPPRATAPSLPLTAVAAGLLVLAVAACGPSNATTMECRLLGTREQLVQRPSPPDSVPLVRDGELVAKLCYGRPSVRGRVIFGGLEPYDTLWRTGANEPTVLHLATDAVIAGMPVHAGQYSIYTVPNPDQWTVVVNASTEQWGLTRDAVGANGRQFYNAYTEEVRAQEVGRAPIETEEIPHVETLTARFQPVSGSDYRLLFEWATTRIIVPLRLGEPDR